MNTANNRLSTSDDYEFDSSGNTTEDAEGRTFVYDAENKQIEVIDNSVSVGTYFYDGDGKRIKKVVPATGETTIFVYDVAGKLIQEHSTIVETGGNAKTIYTTSDSLGSPRVNTDATGNVIARHDYHPFGEEIVTSERTNGVGYTADTIRKKFTSYERDGETELDFAQARMYANGLGRFMVPDPALSSIVPIEPQSFGRYAYGLNNPLKYTDPSGLYNCDQKKFGAECKTFEEQRARMEKKLETLDKKSKEYKDLNRAINAYGKFGVDNGVTVTFGTNKPNAPMHTDPGVALNADLTKATTADNPTGQNTTVTVDMAQLGGNNIRSDEFATALGHEGSHVADAADLINALSKSPFTADGSGWNQASLNILQGAGNSHYASEVLAYQVTIAGTKALGANNLAIGSGKNQTTIWNDTWGNSGNKETLKAIDKHLLNNYNGLSKAAPGKLIPY